MPKVGELQFMSDLGLRIVELREVAGLTQEQLAERIVFTARYVQRMEAGKANPYVRLLPTLAVALDCSVADLFKPTKRSVTRRIGRPIKR